MVSKCKFKLMMRKELRDLIVLVVLNYKEHLEPLGLVLIENVHELPPESNAILFLVKG